MSRSTEKFRWGTFSASKFRVAKNFMHKKGISLDSVEKSLSHSADIIRRRTLLCFERILVSKTFKHRRGEASRFCRKLFHLKGLKKTSPGNHSVFQKISGSKKCFMDKGGGGYHDFPSNFFSHCTEIFRWRTLGCFRKILLSKIFVHSRGHHGFVETFCLTRAKRIVL